MVTRSLLVFSAMLLPVPGLVAQEWLELTTHLRAATGQFHVAAVADADNDGRPDLLFAGSQGDRLLRNTGNALFEDRSQGLPAGPGITEGLCLFDADGDGDQDVLRLMGSFSTSNQDRLYVHDGKWGFSDVTSTQMPAVNADSKFAVAGDVDGDGDNDLLIATDKAIFLLLNDGKGKFADVTANNMPRLMPTAAELALADIDGDKDLDLLIANSRLGLVSQDVIYTNNGKGQFSDATKTNYKGVFSPGALHVKVADFDGNKTPDLLLVDNFNFRLLTNDGKGIFTVPQQLTLPAYKSSPADVVLLDIDDDGDQDIAMFHTRNTNQIFRNDGGWKFSDATSSVSGLPVGTQGRVTAADLDGDNKNDVIYTAFNKRPELFLFQKADTFLNVTSHQTSKADATYTVVEAGDMDGDGAMDLVTSRGVFLNDGRGIFLKPPTSTNSIGSTFILAVGDLDGDGDNDVYVGQSGTIQFPSTTPAKNRLLLNDGKGNLQDASSSNLPGIADFTNRVRAVDIDGDKDLDLLVANANVLSTAPAGVRVLINNGKGVFSDDTKKLLPTQASSTTAVLPGDLDGDGRMDLVAVDTDRLRAYLQTANGTFVAAGSNVPTTLTNLVHGDIGDTTGDGRPDVVLSTQAGIVYLLNDGKGILKPALSVLFPKITDRVRDMKMADVNDDGYPDLLMSMDTGTAGTMLLLNNRGALVDATSSLANHPFCFSFAVGDYDRDGDTDIVLPTNGGGLRMLLNVRRQLHAALPPALGGRYVVDLRWRFRAASNAHAAILAISARAQSVSLPPLGVLGIDTAFMVALPMRPLPGTAGQLEYAFPVPANQKLMGLPVLAQALLATPEGLRLTNTESSVVR